MKTIPLTQNKYALIDDQDYDRVSKLSWYYEPLIKGGGYAAHKDKGQKKIYLHRFLIDTLFKRIDHKDGDGLNNQRNNLRECTPRQNGLNSKNFPNKTSIYRGVSFVTRTKKWLACITLEPYKTVCLGSFDNELHAAMVYDLNAKVIYGEYAKLNFASLLN